MVVTSVGIVGVFIIRAAEVFVIRVVEVFIIRAGVVFMFGTGTIILTVGVVKIINCDIAIGVF